MQVTELRRLRKTGNLKLKDFAKTTGLSQTAIHDIETGRRKPSFDVLIKILQIINKPYYKEIEELFRPTEEEN